MTSPPAPDPGVDCFPVRYCSEGSIYCTVHGTGSPSDVNDNRAIQLFLDADGYIWLVVIAYELTVSDTLVPHWVWLFKSVAVFDCDTVRTAGASGWQPTGGGSHDWFDLIHSGQHKDSVGCDGENAPLLDLDSASFVIRFFKQRGSCCDLMPLDPCNEIPNPSCREIVDCQQCLGGTAPNLLTLTLSDIGSAFSSCGWCDYLEGTYILEKTTGGASPQMTCEVYREGPGVCVWRSCSDWTGPVGVSIGCPTIPSGAKVLVWVLVLYDAFNDRSEMAAEIQIRAGCSDGDTLYHTQVFKNAPLFGGYIPGQINCELIDEVLENYPACSNFVQCSASTVRVRAI